MSRFKTAAMIVNAKSRRGQALFSQACRLFNDHDIAVDAHAVEDPEELVPTLKKALERGPEMVILGGGDGTISSLVDHLVGRDVVLGVLPLGTANSFCRTLGIPLDIPGAVDVLLHGRPRRIDLGMIGNDYFANAATLGIAPKIAQTVPHGVKKYAGRAGYLAWAALQFLRFRPFWVTLTVEGGAPRSLRAVEVRVANGRFHGGELLMEDAAVDSGDIVVECVRGHVKRRLLTSWGAHILRLPQRREDIVVVRGQSIRIETKKPMPISIDGEVLATTPATARIAAGIIEVMAPAPLPAPEGN